MSPELFTNAQAFIREKSYWRRVIDQAAQAGVVDRAKVAQGIFDRWSDGDSLMAIAVRSACSEVILEEMEGLDLGI